MAVLKIPVTPARLQRFEVMLNGTRYAMRFLWNPPAGCWMLDIYTEDRVPILMAIPVITGVDLLGQYRYLDIGVNPNDNTRTKLIVMTYAVDKSPDTVPTFENFGVDGFLYSVTVPNV